MFDLRKNLIERRNIELDPVWAKHYLTYNNYEAQREVRPGHVANLAEKMINGSFRFGEVAFACNGADKDLMVNGQHICHAVIDSGITVPCVFEKFKVSKKADVSDLFRQFEIAGRSLNDFVNAERIALGLESWPKWFASIIVSAATLGEKPTKSFHTTGSLSGIGKAKVFVTKEDKALLLKKYVSIGEKIRPILLPKGAKSIRRDVKHIAKAPIVWVIINTVKIAPQQAKMFWERVRDGERLLKDMPEKRLRDFLIGANRNIRKIYEHLPISNHEYVYRCHVAWNAKMTDVPTKLSYRPGNKPPKLISGL